MNSDEGIYIAFWPKRLKKQLAELEELAVPASTVKIPSFQGLNISAVFKLSAVLLILAAVVHGYIVPQVRVRLMQACALVWFRSLFCGAGSNFSRGGRCFVWYEA